MSSESNLDSQIRFWYIPVRGEGDRIRLLLAESGIPYQELIVAGPALKAILSESPTGKIPILEHGKLRICGPNTIMKYIGDLAGLNGTTKEDQLAVDMWCEYIAEVQTFLWNSDTDTRHWKDDITPKIIARLVVVGKALAFTENAFLVGNKISRADISLVSLLDSINRELPTVLPNLPLIKAYHNIIKMRPQIAKFCASGKRY